MTVVQLKKKVTKQLALYMLLSVIFIIFLICILTYNKAIYNKNQRVSDRISHMHSQISQVCDEIDKKESLLDKYSDIWRRISSNDKYISNWDFELSRLYKEYCISNSEMYMGIPENVEILDVSKDIKKHTKIVKHRVNLSFSAVSDKHVFLFLQSIPSLSGYVIMQHLVLSKEKELNTVVMDQILNGDMIETVRANLVFDWYIILKNEY